MNNDYGAQAAHQSQNPYQSALQQQTKPMTPTPTPGSFHKVESVGSAMPPPPQPVRDRTMTQALHADLQNIADMVSSMNGRLYRIVDKTVGVKASNPTAGVAQQEPANAFQAFSQQIGSLNALLGWQNDLITQLEQVI